MFNIIYIIPIFCNTLGLFILHNKSHNLLCYNIEYLRSQPIERESWKNYSVALMSNTILGVSSLINILTRDVSTYNSLNNLDILIYLYAISYFIYDLYIVNFKVITKKKNEYNVHHFIVLYSIIYTLIYEVYSGYLIWFMTTELSTIFLDMRWFLLKSKIREKAFLSKVISFNFFITYSLFRVIQLPYAEYQFVINYDTTLSNHFYLYRQVSIFFLIYALNIHWYTQILKKFGKDSINFLLPKPYSIYDNIGTIETSDDIQNEINEII